MKSVTITTRIERRAQMIQPQRPPLWFHLEDRESGAFLNEEGNPVLRACASGGGCPAVMVLLVPALKVQLTMDWQFFLWSINFNMTPADVAVELDDHLAFCNQTGLRADTPRRNYLEGKDLTAKELPRFDKDRTCVRSVMTGAEGYNLMTALRTIVTAVAVRRSLMATRDALANITSQNVLIVTALDGNQPPPMKPGKSRPQRLADVDPEDYLYNPRDHRWLFFAANTVVSAPGNASKVWPFPRGKVYPWTGDGWKYTWMPHVSRQVVKYPLSRLRKLGPDEPIPSPYRSA